MNAQPGDLVVCIDDSKRNWNQAVLVKEGQTYLVLSCSALKDGSPSYFLAGVIGYLPGEQCPWDYAAYRFRKLDSEPLIERVETSLPQQVSA